MNIDLIDYDGKIPNLALMRVSSYFKKQRDKVRLFTAKDYPSRSRADRIYLSCLFAWNRPTALTFANSLGDCCLVGGTGIDPKIELDRKIQQTNPDYSLYPSCTYAVGFISRGCNRKCPWCVVPLKEGKLRRESMAKDIVGKKERALFLDNNFLALDDCHKDLEWLAQNKILIDFNQGLDARLVTPDKAKLMAKCKWPYGIRLSLDTDGMIPTFKKSLDILLEAGIQPYRIRSFVLIGFSGLRSDVRRLWQLYQWGTYPFPMGYRDVITGEEPAKEWDRITYNKYRRFIIRIPRAKSLWKEFHKEFKKELE